MVSGVSHPSSFASACGLAARVGLSQHLMLICPQRPQSGKRDRELARTLLPRAIDLPSDIRSQIGFRLISMANQVAMVANRRRTDRREIR